MTKIIKTDSYTQDKALGLMEISKPAISDNTGFLYTKDEVGSTELYYLDADDREIKITAAGSLNVTVDATKLINSPYEVELSASDGSLTFRDTVAPLETLGILKLSSNALKNTQFGYAAGEALTTGTGNTIIGYGAGDTIVTGTNNAFIGNDAGGSVFSTSSNNIAIGTGALGTTTSTINYSVSVGINSGKSLTTNGGVCVGYEAAAAANNTNGVFIGYHAAYTKSSPGSSVIIGYEACSNSNVSLTDCVFIGHQSGFSKRGAYNTAIGRDSLIGNGESNHGTAIGRNSLQSVTTGANNTALGSNSGYSVTTGTDNTILGFNCGLFNADSSHNVIIGSNASITAAAVDKTVIIGSSAGNANTADGTVAIGYQAGTANTSGTGNTYLGYQAGYKIATTASNAFLGYQAGYFSNGASNTYVGYMAGYGANVASAGTDNVAIGKEAGKILQGAAAYNTLIGSTAGDAITTGSGNTLVGFGSGNTIATTSGTTAIGYNACAALTSGTGNVAIGYEAGANMTTSSDCVLIGYQAGKALAIADTDNIAIGPYVMGTSASCTESIGIGSGALAVSTGTGNIVIGSYAGQAVSTGNYNVLVGPYCGFNNLATGSNNVALGYDALRSCNSSDNIAIGYQAGDAINSGTGNILIGKSAGGTISTGVGNIIIGPIEGVAASTRTFKVGYHASNEPILSGVMTDGASTDSTLTANVRTFITYNPDADAETFRIDAVGRALSYGCDATPVDNGGIGLEIQKHTANYNAISLQYKDAIHGCTSVATANTWGYMQMQNASYGSLKICGISDDGTAANESARAVQIYGVSAAVTSGDGTANSKGCVDIDTALIDGTAVASWAATDHIFTVRNKGQTQLVLCGDGDLFNTAGTYASYDVEDDIKLVQSFSARNNPYFDRLKEIGIVSEDGSMICSNKLNMLSIGAIGQLFNIIRALAVKLGVSEDELYALAKQY